MSVELDTEQAYAADRGSHLRVELAAALVLGMGLAIAVLAAHPGLTVIVALAIGAGLATLRRPFAGVLVFLFLMMFRPEELGLAPVVLHLGLAFALLCVVALALEWALGHRAAPLRRTGADVALGFVLFSGGLSIVFAVSRMEALSGWWALFKVVFAYALIRYTATTIPRMRAVVVVIAVAAALSAVLSVLGFSAGEAFVGQGKVLRAIGPTSGESDPNSLANTLVSAVALLTPLAFATGPAPSRVLFAATSALALYVSALTGSRSGMVSLLAVLILLVAVSRRRFPTLLAVCAVGVLLWTCLPPNLKERYTTTLRYAQVETYQTRKAAWEVAASIFRKRPLTGCGVGCYMIARFEEEDRVWLQPHSLYAQLISEVGLLGTAAFVAFIVTVFTTSRRALRDCPREAAEAAAESAQADRRWLRALVLGLTVMLVALLVEGLAGHNLLRWNFYVGAALLVNAYESATVGQALRSPWARLPIEVAAPHPRGV